MNLIFGAVTFDHLWQVAQEQAPVNELIERDLDRLAEKVALLSQQVDSLSKSQDQLTRDIIYRLARYGGTGPDIADPIPKNCLL